MNAEAVTEGEELLTTPAPFALALMNLPDLGPFPRCKRSPCFLLDQLALQEIYENASL